MDGAADAYVGREVRGAIRRTRERILARVSSSGF